MSLLQLIPKNWVESAINKYGDTEIAWTKFWGERMEVYDGIILVSS